MTWRHVRGSLYCFSKNFDCAYWHVHFFLTKTSLRFIMRISEKLRTMLIICVLCGTSASMVTFFWGYSVGWVVLSYYLAGTFSLVSSGWWMAEKEKGKERDTTAKVARHRIRSGC